MARKSERKNIEASIVDALRVDEAIFHPDPFRRIDVMYGSQITPGSLYVLAHDPSPAVRMAVAMHPNAPRAALRHLADYDERLSTIVLRRPYLPGDLVGRILRAYNQRLLDNSRWKGAKVEVPARSQRVLLDLPPGMETQHRRALHQFLTRAPYLADDVALSLLRGPSPVVRAEVFARSDLTSELFEEAALSRGQRRNYQDLAWLLDPFERWALGPKRDSGAAKRALLDLGDPQRVDEVRGHLISGHLQRLKLPMGHAAVVCLRAFPGDPEVVAALTGAVNPAVRALAAVRAEVIEGVEHLAEDGDSSVRAAFAARADVGEQLRHRILATLDRSTVAAVAPTLDVDSLPGCLPTLVRPFAFPDDDCVVASILRRRVVEREDLDDATQLRIAQSGDSVISAFLAERESLSAATVDALNQRMEFEILEALFEEGRLSHSLVVPWISLEDQCARLREESVGDFTILPSETAFTPAENAALAARLPGHAAQRFILHSGFGLNYLASHGAALDEEIQVRLASGSFSEWNDRWRVNDERHSRELAWSGGSDLCLAAREALLSDPWLSDDGAIERALSRPGNRGRRRFPEKDTRVVIGAAAVMDEELRKLGKLAEFFDGVFWREEITFEETGMLAIVESDDRLIAAGGVLQAKLAQWGSLQVTRQMALRSDLLTVDALVLLAYSPFYVVRRALARSICESVAGSQPRGQARGLLRLLAEDEDQQVREIASAALGHEVTTGAAAIPPDGDPVDAVLARQDKDELLALVDNDELLKSLSAIQQARIAEHRSVDVPRALARKAPLLHLEVHEALARSRIFTARRELARTMGSDLDPTLLDLLADDEDEVVRRIARASRSGR